MIDLSGLITAEQKAIEARKASIPKSVSKAQGKFALIYAGLWDDALAIVAAIEDPADRALAEVGLHETQEWRRDSPTLIMLAHKLGLTDEQLDDLFIYASQVKP